MPTCTATEPYAGIRPVGSASTKRSCPRLEGRALSAARNTKLLGLLCKGALTRVVASVGTTPPFSFRICTFDFNIQKRLLLLPGRVPLTFPGSHGCLIKGGLRTSSCSLSSFLWRCKHRTRVSNMHLTICCPSLSIYKEMPITATVD